MKEMINIRATALIPDTYNREIRAGWREALRCKFEGDQFKVVHEKRLRYRLILEYAEGGARSIVVGLSRRWNPEIRKLIPVLTVPNAAFVYEEADQVSETARRVLGRAAQGTAFSSGIWDGLFQHKGTEVRLCETEEDYKDPEWERLVPAECVWSSYQTVTLPNWAMRHAPKRPIGVSPKDRNLYQAWYGLFSTEFRAYAYGQGWVVDPEDIKSVFQTMTEPEAGQHVEFQLDTHQLGCYLLGEGKLERKEDHIVGSFENEHFEFSMKLRNQFTERVAEFIM